MKNLFLISILLLSILSAPASAALYESTWAAESGTWSVDYYTPVGIAGSVIGQTGQYYISGDFIGGGAAGASYTEGGITYLPMFSNYAGTIEFLFSDGNYYTAIGTSHNTYTVLRDSSTGIYLGRSDLAQHSEALLADAGINFFLTVDLIGGFTGYQYDLNNQIIGEQGTVQSITFTVSNVPVPASAWLFISGITILIGCRMLKPATRFT
jgi:hypothetical protein